jgi:hypothetical protein
VTGPRNAVVAETGPQQLSIGSGARALLLRQQLTLLSRLRWAAGKYALSCAGAAGPLLKTGFDLTR